MESRQLLSLSAGVAAAEDDEEPGAPKGSLFIGGVVVIDVEELTPDAPPLAPTLSP
jgi:hypothetical protein